MPAHPKLYTDRSNAARAAKRLGGVRKQVPGGWVVEAAPELDPEPMSVPEQEPEPAEPSQTRCERRADGFYAINGSGETGPFVTQKQALAEARRARPSRKGFEKLAARGVTAATAATAREPKRTEKKPPRVAGAFNPRHQVVVDMLRAKDGTTLTEIATKTGWTVSSSRNFVVWLGKRHNMVASASTSMEGDKKVTTYSLPAA